MTRRTHMVLLVALAGLALGQAVTRLGGTWVLFVLAGVYGILTYFALRTRHH